MKWNRSCTADLAERQVTELVQDHEIDMGHPVGESACFTFDFFLLERV